jgi:hypothetical protein
LTVNGPRLTSIRLAKGKSAHPYVGTIECPTSGLKEARKIEGTDNKVKNITMILK